MAGSKQHRSCDRCRPRKVKCSGDQDGPCERCREEGIECIFSPQKAMGRPRKRQRQEGSNDPQIGSQIHDFDLHGLDIENQPLPSFDEWTMPPYDIALEQGHHPGETFEVEHQPPMPQLNHQNGDGRASDLLVVNAAAMSDDWSSIQSYLPTPPSLSSNTSESISTKPSDVATEAHAVGEQYHRSYRRGLDADNQGPCTCLSSMYLAASNLETTLHAGFPVALVPIKAALTTGRAILLCTTCPMKLASSRQNVMLLLSLFGSIASGIQSLLMDIDAEVVRAGDAGDTKIFDSGDSSSANAHLHTGTPDCPGRMSLELEPEEWQVIVKRAVKKHAFKQKNDVLSLESLVDALEARQRAWHRGLLPSHERDDLRNRAETAEEKDWQCLKFTQNIRWMMDQFAGS